MFFRRKPKNIILWFLIKKVNGKMFSNSAKQHEAVIFTKNDKKIYWKKKKANYRLWISVFFFPRENKKCPWKRFWAFFWFFSRALFLFHAHFLAHFSLFSRPLFFFTPTFLIFLRFFHGEKINFHGHKIDIFHGQLFFSRAKKTWNFSSPCLFS